MNSFIKTVFSLILVSFLAMPAASAAVYEIDTAHSSVSFRIRHLMSRVPGSFHTFQGTIQYDAANPRESKVSSVIQTASIDTGNKKRDNHLRSADFFHVEKFPTMTFETVRMTKVNRRGDQGELAGRLTLNGVTKPVILDVSMIGKAKDPFSGREKVGFSATTKINRRDFGITWNMDDKDGGLVLGDEVEITLEVQAIAKN